MRAPTNRRPPPDHRYTTPTPLDPHHYHQTNSRRDSDASFCSSRPSSAHSTHQHPRQSQQPIPITDRAYQSHAITTINSLLSTSHLPYQIQFKLKPLPSNKDILETIKHLLQRLDYPVSVKLEDDLFLVLKFLNCPVKINKSALKAPGTPHSFPSVLAVIHWLVQIVKCGEESGSGSGSGGLSEDVMFTSSLASYLHYIRGDDDAVDREDDIFMEKFRLELNSVKEDINGKSEYVKELEGKLEAMRSGPSEMERKEEEKSVLEKDMKKFNDLIQQLQAHEVSVEKQMEEKEKELRTKVEERSRICVENEALKRKVEEQGINMRDAERMKRELQSVERDVSESENARNEWEEKCWELNAIIGTKMKELEALQIDCNQSMRRLKLGKDFQYDLNAKGSTPAEVPAFYKSTLKPEVSSTIDEVKRTKMENVESKIHLQQQSADIAAKIKAKEKRIAIHQKQIDELESQINLIKNETHDYISTCEMEARQLQEKFEAESHEVDVVVKEAHELVERSKAELQETMVRSEEEVQMCAHELLALIDSVSKYKEFTVSKISAMKDVVSETAAAIAQVHKDSLPPTIVYQSKV